MEVAAPEATEGHPPAHGGGRAATIWAPLGRQAEVTCLPPAAPLWLPFQHEALSCTSETPWAAPEATFTAPTAGQPGVPRQTARARSQSPGVRVDSVPRSLSGLCDVLISSAIFPTLVNLEVECGGIYDPFQLKYPVVV